MPKPVQLHIIRDYGEEMTVDDQQLKALKDYGRGPIVEKESPQCPTWHLNRREGFEWEVDVDLVLAQHAVRQMTSFIKRLRRGATYVGQPDAVIQQAERTMARKPSTWDPDNLKKHIITDGKEELEVTEEQANMLTDDEGAIGWCSFCGYYHVYDPEYTMAAVKKIVADGCIVQEPTDITITAGLEGTDVTATEAGALSDAGIIYQCQACKGIYHVNTHHGFVWKDVQDALFKMRHVTK